MASQLATELREENAEVTRRMNALEKDLLAGSALYYLLNAARHEKDPNGDFHQQRRVVFNVLGIDPDEK